MTGNANSEHPIGSGTATGIDITCQPNTTYTESLVSMNANGESAPVVKTFTTPPNTGAPSTPTNATQEVVQS